MKLDDKFGFDHFLLSEDSQTFVGAQWGGWWLVRNMLFQGWKESRLLSPWSPPMFMTLVPPSSRFIDDRHVGEFWSPAPTVCTSDQEAQAGALLGIAVLTELGYLINTEKLLAIPSRQLVFGDIWLIPFGKRFLSLRTKL